MPEMRISFRGQGRACTESGLESWVARSGVDSFTQQRVLELREEIAALQRDNESYRRKRSHTDSELNTNELRRLRLLAIKEELLRLSGHSKRIQ
jgi:hypothetical protein